MELLNFANLSWEVALLLRVLVGFGIAAYLFKLIANQGRRTERFLLQFSMTLGIAIVIALLYGVVVTTIFFVVVGMSLLSTFGTFANWKALAISQSRTSLFTFWDDLIAMGLAWVILQEGRFLTPLGALGIVLSFVAMMLFINHGRNRTDGTVALPLRFWGYVGFYSIFWGIAYFGQRFWAHEELPLVTFLLAWYIGAFVSAVLVYLFYNDPDPAQQNQPRIRLKGIIECGFLSVTLVVSMTAALVAYRAPQVIVQPVLFVAEMILPALIGLYVFHERKGFDRRQWAYFALGTVGALIVGLSFHG